MGVESLLFLRLRDNYLKNNITNNKQEKREKKNIQETFSPKTKRIMKRNLSIENFMKFSWSWTL